MAGQESSSGRVEPQSSQQPSSQLIVGPTPFVVSRPGVFGRSCRTTNPQHPTHLGNPRFNPRRPHPVRGEPGGCTHRPVSNHKTPSTQPTQAIPGAPCPASSPVRGEPPWSLSEGRVEPHPLAPNPPGQSSVQPAPAPTPFVVSRAGVPTGPCRTTRPPAPNPPRRSPAHPAPRRSRSC